MSQSNTNSGDFSLELLLPPHVNLSENIIAKSTNRRVLRDFTVAYIFVITETF
jgi:hypothetical protein